MAAHAKHSPRRSAALALRRTCGGGCRACGQGRTVAARVSLPVLLGHGRSWYIGKGLGGVQRQTLTCVKIVLAWRRAARDDQAAAERFST